MLLLQVLIVSKVPTIQGGTEFLDSDQVVEPTPAIAYTFPVLCGCQTITGYHIQSTLGTGLPESQNAGNPRLSKIGKLDNTSSDPHENYTVTYIYQMKVYANFSHNIEHNSIILSNYLPCR